MSGSMDDEAEHELLMPFVAAESNGGEFEDHAFTAGWAMGELWMMLKMLTALEQTDHEMTLLTPLTQQADLIAMHYGWEASFGPTEVDGWTHAEFTRNYDETEENHVADDG